MKTTGTGARQNYALIKSKYNRLGKGSVRLTQSSLFLTKDINPNASSYSFDVLENQTQTLAPDEIRLNINDEFVITHMGVYLYGQWQFGDPATAKTRQLLTYAPIELDKQALNVKDLYAGTLKIAVNNIVYLEKWDTRKHEIVPKVQFANFEPIIAGQSTTGYPATMPSTEFEHEAMVKCEPMLTLSGAKKNEITLALPNALTGGTYTFTNNKNESILINVSRIALRLFGLNAQNGAKFQS
jgi:hypothetical protein